MKRVLKISFFGSSLVSAYWNGAATYYRGILKALFEKGHDITFFEPDFFERQQHRDIPDPEYSKSVVYPAFDESGVRKALEDAGSSDIIIKASGVGIFDELLEKEVLTLRRPGTKIIFWDVDAPATLDRVQTNPQDPFRELIPQYDLILTYGGGDPVVGAYTELGAKKCVPIYNALDPTTHFPAAPEDRFKGKLGFLGNRMPDREMRVWEFFFKPAQMLPMEHFILGGSGWREWAPEVPNVDFLGHVYTKDHNAFNCSTDAVLNISRESMARYGFSPATRIFEAAGAGACIITDKWDGIELFLEPGKEILVAERGEDVVRILKETDRDLSQKIGQAAKERVLKEHTYSHRATQLEKLLLHAGEEKKEAQR
ncbi:MAG: glycosyltransferase [Ignavibacteria bacterium]|jgi:spore maturation protein CgeB|nr:glycosyltransferase [Ignavibacteria bacterium]MCU7502189.1 glycosyltransferase [Ignavibacteria bacterium]MCU7517406.1 glycosyltransferase [Ignavibacteria bacterium]